MTNFSNRDEMLRAFGPFSVLFGPSGKTSNSYLSLLHLGEFASKKPAVRLIEKISRTIEAEEFAIELLKDNNWRPHLVGAVATYFARWDSAITQCWQAIDAGSWVTPQLVATLSLVDDSFYENAIRRLENGCVLSDDPTNQIEDSLKRHSAQGPAGSIKRSGKTAASLAAILRIDFPSDEIRELLDSNEVQDLIAQDYDNSGRVAENWRRSLQELSDQG